MGTGKTTIGRILGNILGYTFIDSDMEIERRCKANISEIFRLKGEYSFRDIESQVISEISKLNNTVIACGGGVIKRKANIDNLKKNGTIVCLKANAEVIYKRIKNSGEVRPLIRGKSIDQLIEMLHERETFYNEADFIFDTSKKSPQAVAEEIIGVLSHTK